MFTYDSWHQVSRYRGGLASCGPEHPHAAPRAGEEYTFTIAEGANGAGGRISVNYDGFIDDVSVGDTLLVDGGIQSLRIVAKDGPDVRTEVVDGGIMKSRCGAGPLGITLRNPPVRRVRSTDGAELGGVLTGHGMAACSGTLVCRTHGVSSVPSDRRLPSAYPACGQHAAAGRWQVPGAAGTSAASEPVSGLQHGDAPEPCSRMRRRHLNIRGKSANLPAITERDWLDIKFGVDMDVDYYALSFVRNADVIYELKRFLAEQGARARLPCSRA